MQKNRRNAYTVDSQWKKTPRPGLRNNLGEVSATLEEMNHRELALGTHSRSGDQWDIWQANGANGAAGRGPQELAVLMTSRFFAG